MLEVLPQTNQVNNSINYSPEVKRQLQEINPLQIDNPSNPTSWYEGITKTLSSAQNWAAKTQDKLTDSILGGKENPNVLRHALFQALAVMGKMYDLFSYAIGMQKENQKQEAKTQNLALPSEIAMA